MLVFGATMAHRIILATPVLLSLFACTVTTSTSGDGGSGNAPDSGGTAADSGATADSGTGADSGGGSSQEAGGGDATTNGPDASQGDAAPAEAAAGDGSTAGDGGVASASCYVASQDRCKEFPSPTGTQAADLAVECSSTSGVFASPAGCPTTGFLGKCTTGTGPGSEVDRWYTPADATYEQSFCTSNASGVWSTTF
jgi:hypothetical protein